MCNLFFQYPADITDKYAVVKRELQPKIKIEAVENFGARVILNGNNYSEAEDHMRSLIKETDMVFIHPFDDELVIAGQGTVADELLRQNPGRLDAVFIPVGGGGLISGMAAYIKTLRPEIRVVGVEPADSDDMYQSLAAGRKVSLESVGFFTDGVAVRDVGDLTFDLCSRFVDEIIRVTTDELCGGIKAIYQATRSIVEPAGGLAMAGMFKYIHDHDCQNNTLVAINSGANMNFERLRYVAERTLIGEKQEALFAVTIPEKPGSLKTFCKDMVGNRNITEFNYRLSTRSQAGYKNLDITDNDLAKTHIRYMVGGRSDVVEGERLFRFWFPETPHALTRFLVTTPKLVVTHTLFLA